MGSIERRIERLEGCMPPEDDARARARKRAIFVLDTLAAIIRRNGQTERDLIAQIQEHNPTMREQDARSEARRRIVQSDPEGAEIYEDLEAMRREAERRGIA